MEPASQPADRDRVREAVRSRSGSLARAAQAGQPVAGVPSVAGYRGALTRAGFAGVSITATRKAGDGGRAAIIRAVRP
jgi:hypothetical protein